MALEIERKFLVAEGFKPSATIFFNDILYYICSHNHPLMTTDGLETYQSPQIVTVEIEYEGVVCYSNEGMDEIQGEW